MRSWILTVATVVSCLTPLHVAAYNPATHRDIVAYAYELMSLAETNPLASALPQDPDFAAFRQHMVKSARALSAMPANLPPPRRTDCIDPKLAALLAGLTPHWGGDLNSMSMGTIPYPIDTGYISHERSCGVDGFWFPGTLYKQAHASDRMHAGNVLGFWSAAVDDLLDDWRLQIRPTNAGGLSFVKKVIEDAGGAALGTIWIPFKCFLDCGSAIATLDFYDCEACVRQAIEDSRDVVHDGVATVDGFFPGVGEFKSGDIVGLGHHIDLKGSVGVAAVGWSPLTHPRYDDIGGLYVITAGPYGIPGQIERAAIAAATSLGMSVNYDKSQGARNYEVLDGADQHANSVGRKKRDWEYLDFSFVPFTPLDNLGWHGWNAFKQSRQTVASTPAVILQTRNLGWPLHALADASVPMHVVSTFAWGHRPYEDAVEQLGRPLLGGGPQNDELERAIQVLTLAATYRESIKSWRAANPGSPDDVPIRDLVTTVATKSYAAAMAHPSVFDDASSSAYLTPLVSGASVDAYKVQEPFMRARLAESVAATIAFLDAVADGSL